MTRRFLVLCGLVVVASCCAAGAFYSWRWYTAAPPPEPPAIDLSSAEPLVAHVIQKAVAAVHEKPYSAEAWGRLGLVLRAHAYDDNSDLCFAQAERLDPQDPRWPYLQGLHLRFREPGAALPYIERAVERCERYAPDQNVPRLLLAEMLLEKGRIAEAETHLHQVLARDPNNVRANYDLGLAAFGRDDLKECIRCLLPWAANPFAQQKVASQLAIVYLRLEDKEAAAQWSRQARTLPADLPWQDPYAVEYQSLEVGRLGRLQHVEALEQVDGSLAERLQILNQLVEEFPNDPYSRLTLGKTLLQAHDYPAAERVLRETVHLSPDEIQAHYHLSLVLFVQAEQLSAGGDGRRARAKYLEAAEAAGRAAELKPDHGLAYFMRGMALRRLGDRVEAVAALRRGVQCRPDKAEAHQVLGETLADNGQDAEALVELQIAVDLAKKEPEVAGAARQRYAQVLLRAFLPVFP